MSPNKRKTILSALVVLTNNEEYKTQMNKDVNAYNEEIQKQEMSLTQRENWVEKDEIKRTYDKLEKKAKEIYKKPNKSTADLQEIQNFIIIALLGGVLIPPRRSLDYCNFKLSNIDETKDNYYDTSSQKFVFNSYKTAKSYGRQEVSVPVKLRNIIKKWKTINPTDYLIFDTNMNPLTAVKLNQRMNKIFGDKKIGINSMRHTYLTSQFKNTRQEGKKLERVMEQMGSSIDMADTYIKNDSPS
jgi:integrase